MSLWPGEEPTRVSDMVPQYPGEGEMNPGQMAAEGMSTFDKVMVGAGREAVGAWEGARQMLPEGFGGYTPEEEQRIQGEHQAFEQGLGDSVAASAGRMLPYLAIPGASGMAGGRIMAPIVDAGVAGLTEGMQYVDPGESRLGRATTGAAFGGLGRLGLDEIGGRLASRWNRVSDNTAARNAGDELSEMAAEQFDIPMSYGDALGGQRGANVRRLEVGMEQLPFGTSKFRGNQNAAAQKAAQGLTDAYPVPPGGSGTTIQKSLRDVMDEQYAGVGRAYDDVQNIVGDAPGTMGEAADAAAGIVGEKSAMGQYGTRGAGDTPDVGSDVTKFLQRVDDETGDVLPLDDLTFAQMRTLRSELGDEIAKFGRAGDKKSARPLKKLKAAIERDMNDLAEGVGGDAAMEAERVANRANAEYRSLYHPKGKKPAAKAVSSAIETDKPSTIFKSIIDGKDPDGVRVAIQAMDQKGVEAVRHKIVQEAMDAATNADGIFSPAKYANRLEKNLAGIKEAFPQTDQKVMTDLIKVMKGIKRAGQFAENPPTGNRTIVPMIAGAIGTASSGLPGGAAGVAAVLGSTKGLTWLTTSKAGKSVLRKLARTKDMSNMLSVELPKIKKMIENSSVQGAVRSVVGQQGREED